MPKIVTIGGGTGSFVVLSALRRLPDLSLTAIVTAADDGGSTGRLRDAYGILPPGDARQALVALAEDGNVLRELFSYRFTKGDVAGHNLGNLFITALSDLLGSDTAALAEASKILRVCGTVIPATEVPATLVAHLADGTKLVGEHLVSGSEGKRARIEKVELKDNPALTEAARVALAEADVVILGPGCLYSSTIAALLPKGMREAIASSPARVVYITNLFSRAGETDGYTLKDHVREITGYAGRAPDAVLVHDGSFSPEVVAWYAKEGEHPLADDLPKDANIHRVSLASVHVVPPIENDPVRRSLMRHDPEKLASAIAPLIP